MKKMGKRMVARLMAGVLTVSLGLGPVGTVRAEEIRSEDMLEVITADHGEGVLESEKIDALGDEAASVSENGAIGGGENEEDNEPKDETVKEKPDGGSAEAEEQEESQTDSMTEGEKPAESSEEDKEAENVGENDVESDISVEQQEAVRTAGTVAVAQAADIISGTDWTLDAAGKLTIWSDAGMKDWVDSGQADYNEKIISAEIQNGVTSIEEYAFFSCSSLASITIPSSVARIGGYAFFQCSSLTSVTIQVGVESIGNDAFSGCSSLKSITLPAGVTSVEAGTFSGCSSLTSIELPASVTDIGDRAFEKCKGLKNLEIPSSVTSIGGAAFTGCSSLTSIMLPIGVTSIDAFVFEDCSSLVNITVSSEMTSILGGAFYGCNSLTGITLPSSLVSIGADVFNGCSSLSSITIPSGVTSIGRSAFNDCSRLESVTMQGITPPKLGDANEDITGVFDGCKFIIDSVQGIKVPAGKTEAYKNVWVEWADYITDETLIASGKDWLLDVDGKLTIWSDVGMENWRNVGRTNYGEKVVSVEIRVGVTNVGEDAFLSCSNLQNISLPTGVVSIGDNAFNGCSSLKDLVIPSGVTSIGKGVFVNCSGLESITLPIGVTSIEASTFRGCSSLTSITLPIGVTSIGGWAFRDCSSLKSVTIPSDVTCIGNGTFLDCNSLTSITLPSGVTRVEDNTFWGCGNLKYVTLPKGVVSIGNRAFKDCSNLTSIKIPLGVTSLGESVFSGCAGLTSVEIPSGVTSIGMEAFYNCSSLASIELPFSVTSIGGHAFRGCSSLTSMIIPSGVTSIEGHMFNGCSSLKSVTIPSGVKSIGGYAFNGCSSLTSITIPFSVTKIWMYAFNDCSNLTRITIPSNVTSIGAYAFHGCSSLERVMMMGAKPSTLGVADEETGKTYVFDSCKFVTDNAKGIKVLSGRDEIYKTAWTEWADYITSDSEEADILIASGTDWTLDADGKLMIRSDAGMEDWWNAGRENYKEKVASVEIQNGVTSILGDSSTGSFSDCKYLTSIAISNSVTSIGGRAFRNCSGLKSVTIPSDVTSIGGGAFSGCSGLTSITLPAGVTSIEAAVFSGCSGLTSITIPRGVTKIGSSAFYDCSSLTGIEFPSGVTSIGWRAFCGCSSLENIELPTGVTSIEDWTFYSCNRLASIEIPVGVTSIGDSAFWCCRSLTDIVLPSSTTSIGANAFYYCSSLESVTMQGTTPPTLGVANKDSGKTYVFGSCKFVSDNTKGIKVPLGTSDAYKAAWTEWADYIEKDILPADGIDWIIDVNGKLKIQSDAGMEDWKKAGRKNYGEKVVSVEIQAGVTSIVDDAFLVCNSLTSITIPDSVTSIGTQAFRGCNSLTGIKLPAGVTRVEDYTFCECSNLRDITLPTGVVSIGDNAFRGCSNLTSIVIPSGVKVIDYNTFYNCSSLRDITLPANVTYIGSAAFYECNSLTGITIPSDVTRIGSFAFTGCRNLTSITIPSGVTSIEAGTFSGCSSLERVTMQGTTPPTLDVANEDTGETYVFKFCKFVIDKTEGIKVPSGTAEAYKAAWPEWADYITDGSVPTDGKGKVKAVKQAVEVAVKNAIDKALAGTKVTNDNAEETAAKIETLIPDAVAEAMAETGISTDEVEVGEAGIEIKPAGDSEGSIQITIHITSKEDAEQSDSAVVQVPIVTSEGDTDLTKDAQKMVEDALKKITVTNETTREDILDALKKELYDEVTVESIEKFNKVEATEEAPGSISLSIKITRDGQTAVINTSVLIAQLGKKTGVYIRFTDYYELDGSIPCYKYTGAAVKPTVEVYNNETMLIPGADYTIAYKNNIKVGSTAALTVKGKGNFSGTSNVVKFKIINADIERDTVHPTEMTVVVNTKVAPTIMNGTKKLTTKDYRLEGTGLSNSKYAVATAEGNPNILTVKGIGSYEGSSFDIRVRVIEKSAAKKLAVVVARDFKPVYNGMTINMSSLINNTQGTEGVITVTDAKDRTKILKEGTDFAVLCSSNLLCAGTVKFTITGMGEYTGSVSKSFKISPLRITDSSRFSVSFDERKTYEYKASGTKVDNLLVTYLGETGSVEDDKILTEGVDYKVTYSNHKKVSGAKNAGLKITFLGNYKGSSAVSRTFKIVAAKMSVANTEVTVPDKVYSKANRAYKSTPIVTVDGVAIKASNYTVSYAWATGSEAADNTKYVSDNKVKITIAEGDIWAKVKVTITPKQTSNYALDKGAVLTGEYYVRKADNAVNLTKAKVTFLDKNAIQLKSLEYNGNPFYTPAGNNMEANNAAEDPNAVYLRVSVNGRVVDPDLYDVIWTNATEKGRATVVIRGKGIDTGKGIAVGSKNQSVNIKAMALKGKTPQSLMENTKNAISNLMSIF